MISINRYSITVSCSKICISVLLYFRESVSDDENGPSTSPAQERKFLVFESCLRSLLMICATCMASCEVVKQACIGTLVSFKTMCVNGHERLWHSQPFSGNMPWGNLICASGILFSGCNPYKVFKYFNSINAEFIAPRTYHLLQRLYITPCIKEIWGIRQLRLLQELGQRELVLGGDGRCDSPGHSAKYGSYSFVDLNTNKVLDVQLVQVRTKNGTIIIYHLSNPVQKRLSLHSSCCYYM